tara:strand:- start:956 stop:1189 length:234 start_codon:yes stop_codon:yes gene_type:complete
MDQYEEKILKFIEEMERNNIKIRNNKYLKYLQKINHFKLLKKFHREMERNNNKIRSNRIIRELKIKMKQRFLKQYNF